jgi:hypothetical protein
MSYHDYPIIDNGDIEKPEEKSHPVAQDRQLCSIIASELVGKAHPIHFHIIVKGKEWNSLYRLTHISQYFSDSLAIV